MGMCLYYEGGGLDVDSTPSSWRGSGLGVPILWILEEMKGEASWVLQKSVLGMICSCSSDSRVLVEEAAGGCFWDSDGALPQGAGVMSVYLFTKRYAEEEMYRPHPAFYRPRLSDCSDYSGQFLQPEAWRRGRSPSDISSDVSIQMTQNYPPAIKYPDHLHISTSPC